MLSFLRSCRRTLIKTISILLRILNSRIPGLQANSYKPFHTILVLFDFAGGSGFVILKL